MMKWGLIGLFLSAAVAAGGLYLLTSQPYRGFSDSTLVDLPRGARAGGIARLLAERGVIPSPYAFLAVRAMRPSAKLQAGEYQFTEPASAWQVFDRISRGDVHRYELTIPEGSHRWDVARLVGELGFISAADFQKEAANPKAIKDLDPQAESLEGYLFPSTYHVTRHTTAAQLAKLMTDEFRKEWKRLNAPKDIHHTVTLASLVEKETAVAAERPVVASVYQNRLNAGMKLDCDPTVIYAALLENRYRGTIYKSDLESDSPYNTYNKAGLPPGPIANPGRAALAAAVNPAETEYLFFVAKADGSGRHEFTSSLKDHSKAVSEYRRAQKKGVQEGSTPGVARGASGRRGG